MTPGEKRLGYSARVSARWALGAYEKISHVYSGLGRELVQACRLTPGQRLLDVAAGTGNATLPAARAGARVVAIDLAVGLVNTGAKTTRRLGVDVHWCVADAQRLPFPDAAFDMVLSCIGAMFAPDQEAAAAELARVCRPGGGIAMANWTPHDEAALFNRLVMKYTPQQPTRPARSPLEWGDPTRVGELLGPHVTSLRCRVQRVQEEYYGTPREKRDYFSTYFPPLVAAYQAHRGNPEAIAALDAELLQHFTQQNGGRTDGPGEYHTEYLLVLADK